MERGFTMDQALAEAARCLLCHDAPCSAGCPASTEPDRFIRKLRLRNLKGAVAVIKENNILGGVCAVVCPTCSLCAGGCVAAGLDQPIRIGEIQRWLVEYGWDLGFKPLKVRPGRGLKVAIVGSGPAGVTCAAELALAGFEPMVFEKESKPGGMLRYGIPNHRLSEEFLDRELADATALGVTFRCNSPISSKEDLEGLFGQGFKAVFVATGAWQAVTLDLSTRGGEVLDGLSFLRRAKAGGEEFNQLVSGRRVAVIGGGDTAMDSAVCALGGGAADVSILYRRSFAEMPGSPEEKDEAIRAGVHFLILTQPVDYVVNQGTLAGIRVVRTALGEPDDSGRRRPVPVAGTEHTLEAEVVVEAIGLEPTAVTAGLGLEVDSGNRIVVDLNGLTSRRAVFAGGDAVRGPSIVARAVNDGKQAARAIMRELGEVS